MKTNYLLATVIFAASVFGRAATAAVTLSENFGTLSNGNLFTSTTGTRDGSVGSGTGNTAFTYVRASPDAGSLLQARNPGSFTGASALVLSTGTSITGVGSSSLTTFNQATLTFSLGLPSAFGGTNDVFFIGLGTGATFTGNSTYNTSDLAFAYQISNGVLQEIRSSSVLTLATLTAGQKYDIGIQVNRGFIIADDHGIVTFPYAYSKVFVNGLQVSGNYQTLPLASMTGMRMYSTNGLAAGGGHELDNVLLQNAIVPVPEPATMTLGALGSLGLFYVLRRRR